MKNQICLAIWISIKIPTFFYTYEFAPSRFIVTDFNQAIVVESSSTHDQGEIKMATGYPNLAS